MRSYTPGKNTCIFGFERGPLLKTGCTGYKFQRDPDGSGSTTRSPVWAEIPTPLNDTMNQKLDQLAESLSAYRTSEESDELEHFSFKIKYKWTNDDLNYAPFVVDMVLDLHNMTQRNMQSGTEQAVASSRP